MTVDEQNKFIADLTSVIQSGIRQTRDGSHLLEKSIKEAIETLKSRSSSNASSVPGNIKTNKQFQDEITDLNDQLNKLNIPLKEKNAILKDYNDKEKKARKEQIESLRNYTKLRDEAEKKIIEERRKEAKRNIYSSLSNGKSETYLRYGNSVTTFGNSIKNVLGEKSKLGGAFTDFGGKLTKFSGALGIASQAAEIIGKGLNMIGENLQHQAKQQEFENQKEAIVHQRQLALTQSFGEEQQAIMGNTITKAQNEIASNSGLAIEANSIAQNADAAATEIGLKSFTDIAGGAFEAAAQQISLQTSINKFQKHMETQGKIVAAKNALADTQLGLKQENIAAKNASTRTNANAELSKISQLQGQESTNYWMGAAGQLGGAIPIFNDVFNPLMNGFKGVVQGSQALSNAKLEGVNQEKKYLASLNETRTNIKTTMEGTAADFRASAIETVANMENQIYDAEQDALERKLKAELNFTQGIFNSFQKAETAAYQMGRSLNFNGAQLSVYARTLAATQETVGKWGKTMEDMAKLQTSYQETTGVNKLLSERDFNKSFANGFLIGDDLVSQLNSGMEVFNTSVSDSNDMFYEMYKSVTKMGLSGKKYAKDLVNNLKIAEKHNFRGGVKGLMEMSKWAQNVRFNTSALDGMLNKVQEGGLEGVIKQSAELQVLGGNFAMGSDPMAMAWESFNDPEAYAKRVNGMLSGLGVFNSRTGDVEVKGANRMIMNQAAKSLGMNVEDLMKQIRQEGRVNQIKSFVGGRFDNDQLSAIANNATYNNGQWTVNTVNGTKNITELTADDVASLSGVDDNGTVEENVQKMLSTAEEMKGTVTTISNKLQNNLWDKFNSDAKQMIENVNKNFKDGNFTTMLSQNMSSVVTAQGDILNILNGKTDGNDNIISALKSSVETLKTNVTTAIGETNTKLGTMITQLQQAFPDAHADDSYLTSFRQNRNTEAWMRNAGTLGTDAFNTMNELYTNFDKYYDKMSEGEKWLVSHWDPNDDITDAKISKVHQREVEDLNVNDIRTNLKTKYGKEYVDAFNKQIRWMRNGNNQENGAYYALSSFSEGVADDGLISPKGTLSKINDGLVIQNGVPTRINSADQVLAAKKDGPIDRMLDMVQPRQVEIKPISININGNIQLNGTNVDFTSQMQNDPNFKEALWKIISVEVSKRADNSGRTYDPLYNRIQTI